jgi:pyruvate kinase
MMRKTKIVATLGPASDSEAVIKELLTAGVDVFRFNFSHGTRERHGEIIDRVRRAAGECGRIVALLQDLSGPKIRTGTLHHGAPITLAAGDPLRIVIGDAVGEPGRVSTTYADLPKAVREGSILLLDDGRIQLRVDRVSPGELQTTVVYGGALGEHKGINVPGVELPTTGLTDKDIGDLQFGAELGVDFIALSFVQTAAVLRQARSLLAAAGAPDIPLVAKLERPEAIARLEEIVRESDAVMVARGDLGLELPLESVPRVQKAITQLARALEVPVIVATQVLESMRTEPRPTRAEVSDAANAVDEGVDAIMLAGETAAGAFPVKAVQTLDLVIRDAESVPVSRSREMEQAHLPSGHARAVCESAVTLAERGGAAAIVAVTRSGQTVRVLSALRPRVPVFAATDRGEIARRLALVWGVTPVLTDLSGDVNVATSRIGAELVTHGMIAEGSVIVLVSITPDLTHGPSNFVKVQQV